MYKSPIEVITSQMDDAIKQMQKQMQEQQEEQIFQSVLNVGVNVDKDELIRALKYDRDQYAKGYSDGANDFAERLKIICDEDNFVDRHDILQTIQEMRV